MSVVGRRADAAVRKLKDVKTSTLQMFGPDHPTPPTLILWRGDALVAFVYVAPPWDSEKVAMVAELVTQGLRADCAVLATETWAVDAESKEALHINPDTGEDWGEGGMDDYIEQHGRGGVVKDALSVLVVSRDGIQVRTLPFEPVQGAFGWSVNWLPSYEDQYGSDGSEVGGYFVECLRVGVHAGLKVEQRALWIVAESKLPPEVVDADLDSAVALSLSQEGVAEVMLCAEEHEVTRVQRLKERTGVTPVRSDDVARAATSRWN